MIRSLARHLPESVTAKLENEPIYTRIANGAFWSLTGSAFAQGLTIVSSIAVARLLGGESYGKLGIIQSTIGTVVIFAGPALGVAATKHIAELRNSDPSRVGDIIGMTSTAGLIASLLMMILLWIGAPFLASEILNSPDMASVLVLASLALLFNGLTGVQNGVLAGFEAFRAMAHVNLWRGLVSLPAMILGAWLWGLSGSVLALGVIALVTVVFNQRAIHQELAGLNLTINPFALRSEWHILYSFSLPALLSSVVVVATTWSASALLVNQPNGYMEMGVYNAANQWRIAILFLPSVLARPMLPMLSESLNRSRDDYMRVLKLNTAVTAIITGGLSVIVIVASPWIMAAYGSDFAGSWAVLALLVMSGLFSAIAGGIGNAIWSMGKMWLSLGLNTVWAVTFIGSSIILLKWGALGLSGAYLISYSLQLVLVGLFVFSWMRFSSDRRLK